MTHSVLHALSLTGSMTWEILWALILGFTLSAVVQAVVRRSTVVALLGDDRPRTLAIAAGLGAASSSCSYAAVALARSLFRKGANFTAAMAFEIGSTNLVVELGIILALLMGWQFTAAEFVGGPLMIVALAGCSGCSCGRDLSTPPAGRPNRDWPVRWKAMPRWTCRSRRRFVSATFVVARRLYLGVPRLRDGMGRHPPRSGYRPADRGRLAAWVPESSGNTSFSPTIRCGRAVGTDRGPVVAIVSFVCSIGNVPLAAVLWNGGISFGGVVAFIFADLLILPILNIYRKYYGTAMMLTLLGTFYAAMVAAGYLVEFLFGTAGLIPSHRNAMVMDGGISWNYTTWLNIVFIGLAVLLVVRFVVTGGMPMLRAMGGSPDAEHGHDHHAH